MVAEKLVMAPNYAKSTEELGDLSQGQLKKWQIDKQFRINVNSPQASLHIGVIEPKKEWTIECGSFWYNTLKKPFENAIKLHPEILKKHPDFKHPKVMYWVKYPVGDSNRKSAGFNFALKPQQDHILWQKPKGTVICLHGIKMDKTLLATSWGQIFAVHGYRSIMVDLRGHGKSTGDYMTYGRVESTDISQVIDYLQDNDMLNGKLIIMGGSYGAAVAIQTAAIDCRIDAVVAMEPFTSLKEVAPEFAKKNHGLFAMLLGKGGIRKIVDKAGIIANFDPDTNTPLQAVKQIKVPILFIHGKEDKLIPFRHSQELNDAACYGKILIIDGKNHLNLVFQDIYPIRDVIIDWLESNNIKKTTKN